MATKKKQKQATPEDVGAALFKLVSAFEQVGNKLKEGYDKQARLELLKIQIKEDYDLDFDGEELETIDTFLSAYFEKTEDFLKEISRFKTPEVTDNGDGTVTFHAIQDDRVPELTDEQRLKMQEIFGECNCEDCTRARESEKDPYTVGDERFGIGREETLGVSKDEHVELPIIPLSDEAANMIMEKSVEHQMSKLETAMQAFKIFLALAIVVILLAILIKI